MALPPKVTAIRRDTLAALVARVARHHGLSAARMTGRGRSLAEIIARRMFVQVAREFGFSYPEIGRAVERDHSTVMFLMKERMEIEEGLMRDLRALLDRAQVKTVSHPFNDGASVLTAELTAAQTATLGSVAAQRLTTPGALLSSLVTVVIRDDLFNAVLDS